MASKQSSKETNDPSSAIGTTERKINVLQSFINEKTALRNNFLSLALVAGLASGFIFLVHAREEEQEEHARAQNQINPPEKKSDKTLLYIACGIGLVSAGSVIIAGSAQLSLSGYEKSLVDLELNAPPPQQSPQPPIP